MEKEDWSVEVRGKRGVKRGGERMEKEDWSVEVRGKRGVERGGERKRRGGAWW